jgi:hypothetical protein
VQHASVVSLLGSVVCVPNPNACAIALAGETDKLSLAALGRTPVALDSPRPADPCACTNVGHRQLPGGGVQLADVHICVCMVAV